MPAYECMRWALGMFGSFWGWLKGRPRWLDAGDIVRNLSSVNGGERRTQICIMVGSEDMMIDVDMCRLQAAEYREALEPGSSGSRKDQTSLSASHKHRSMGTDVERLRMEDAGGVRLVVVEGAGHHSQNDVQRDQGAQALRLFLEQVDCYMCMIWI